MTGELGRKTPRPEDGGFSLIEIAVGVIVLVIALLGLSLAMITAYRVERIATGYGQGVAVGDPRGN